jgi:hypothetical protein
MNSVNMYASCWICTKVREVVEPPVPGMEELSIGESALGQS